MKKDSVILCFLLFVTGCSSQHFVLVGTETIAVEIADNPAAWARGLQHRTSLADHSGMLFIFPFPRTVTFWMKDTFIPLDMIFINQEKTIVAIEKNVPPCEHDPCATYTHTNVSFVLEVNAGFSEQYDIKEHQIVRFS